MTSSTTKNTLAGGLLTALLLCATLLAAQRPTLPPEDLARLKLHEDTLGILAYAIVNDSFPENRLAACRAFIPALVRALKTPNAFRYPFERLQSISIQYPPDSTFRVFSFHLYVDDDTYRYYGAIQMNTPELRLFPLIDRSFALEGDAEQAVLPPDQWFGGVYYNLFQAQGPKKGSTHYLLFGYNALGQQQRRKFVDVLTFDDQGKPTFGAPVFVSQVGGRPFTRHRLVMEYSAEATMRLNYDHGLGMLIFDHLQPIASRYGPTFVPDGTYEGYELKNGRWMHIEKVFHETMDEAPRPYPVLDKRSRNIFGKQR